MAVFPNPLDTRKRVRVNTKYDNQDVIVENRLSQTKEFRDVPRVDQLTQGGYNLSPFTRENTFEDVTVTGFRFEGRMERYNTPNQKRKFRISIRRGPIVRRGTI